MSLAFSETSPNAAVCAWLEDQLGPNRVINVRIDARDEMFIGAHFTTYGVAGISLSSYFKTGWQLMHAVRQIASWRFGGFDHVRALLDFACGYGRFTRFLVTEMPPDRVWASDIYADGVSFVANELGVHGVVSVTDPDTYRVDQRFDIISVASLFSHLPERTFTPWIRALYRLLTPEGVLLFSVQDESMLPESETMGGQGIKFYAASESQLLDAQDYGTTYVAEAFVADAIGEATNHEAQYRRLPRGFGHHQDVYLVSRATRDELDTLDFHFGPQGYLDEYELRPDRTLKLRGWSADATPGVEVADVQAFINGRLLQRGLPYLPRPDVSRYLRSDRFLHSGYQFEGRLPEGFTPSRDVLLIKAISSDGSTYVLHCSTIEDANLFLAKQLEAHAEQARQAELHKLQLAIQQARGLNRARARLVYHYHRAGVFGILERLPGYLRPTCRP